MERVRCPAPAKAVQPILQCGTDEIATVNGEAVAWEDKNNNNTRVVHSAHFAALVFELEQRRKAALAGCIKCCGAAITPAADDAAASQAGIDGQRFGVYKGSERRSRRRRRWLGAAHHQAQTPGRGRNQGGLAA